MTFDTGFDRGDSSNFISEKDADTQARENLLNEAYTEKGQNSQTDTSAAAKELNSYTYSCIVNPKTLLPSASDLVADTDRGRYGNRDGNVNLEEVHRWFQNRMGGTVCDTLMEGVRDNFSDIAGMDNEISIPELVAYQDTVFNNGTEEPLPEIFELADSNDDRELSEKEISKALNNESLTAIEKYELNSALNNFRRIAGSDNSMSSYEYESFRNSRWITK